jgi:hypothetical protein
VVASAPMADENPHVGETQSQFLARAVLAARCLHRIDPEDVDAVDAMLGAEWTQADEARLRAIASGTGY